MANPFDNLLNASLAASQLRQGYNQMAMQDKQATGSLLQRRAEQEQQGQQFIMSLNQQKSEQAARADQFNRSLNFNYSQLRQQDKWANADDIYRNTVHEEGVRQFGMTFEEGKRQFGLSHGLAASQASHYGKSVNLLELQWEASKRKREIELETAELDLAQRKEDSAPWAPVALTTPPEDFFKDKGIISEWLSGKGSRAQDGGWFRKAIADPAAIPHHERMQEEFKTHPVKKYLDGRMTELDNIHQRMSKGKQIDSKTYASAQIEYVTAVSVFEKNKHLMSKGEREIYSKRLQLLQSAFDPTPPPEK